MAQNHPLVDIKGMPAGIRRALADHGITTAEDLLKAAGDYGDREKLAAKIGVTAPVVTEWVNRADLTRLKGVGLVYAHMLEECGVDSCKELRHRVPENLAATLAEVNRKKRLARSIPTARVLAGWIAEAKLIAR